jgi:hypothetical protein
VNDVRPYPHPLSPVEALAVLVQGAVFPHDSKRRWPRPGALVERAPEHVREGLRRLTSDEVAGLRFEAWMSAP